MEAREGPRLPHYTESPGETGTRSGSPSLPTPCSSEQRQTVPQRDVRSYIQPVTNYTTSAVAKTVKQMKNTDRFISVYKYLKKLKKLTSGSYRSPLKELITS